jgi:hypothetical protein
MTFEKPTTIVPAAAVLSSWHQHPWQHGLDVANLHALDRVTVRTQHSVYEIIVSSPSTGEVLVRGGEFFPEFTAARLAGSTLGGSFLKLRSIHAGFRMEFGLGRQFVLTSPVRTITVRRDVTVAG